MRKRNIYKRPHILRRNARPRFNTIQFYVSSEPTLRPKKGLLSRIAEKLFTP